MFVFTKLRIPLRSKDENLVHFSTYEERGKAIQGFGGDT
jgi:hypothetical protein